MSTKKGVIKKTLGKSHFLPIKLHHCNTLIYRLQSKIIELKLFLNFVSLLTANYGKANITSKIDKDNKKKEGK